MRGSSINKERIERLSPSNMHACRSAKARGDIRIVLTALLAMCSSNMEKEISK